MTRRHSTLTAACRPSPLRGAGILTSVGPDDTRIFRQSKLPTVSELHLKLVATYFTRVNAFMHRFMVAGDSLYLQGAQWRVTRSTMQCHQERIQ